MLLGAANPPKTQNAHSLRKRFFTYRIRSFYRIHSQHKRQNYVDHMELKVYLEVVEMMNSPKNRCAMKRKKERRLKEKRMNNWSHFLL